MDYMFIKSIWITKYYMVFLKKALFIFLDNRRISRRQKVPQGGNCWLKSTN